jgi:hypothetical protein
MSSSPLDRLAASETRRFHEVAGAPCRTWRRAFAAARATQRTVTPGLDPGAQAATVVAGRARPILDARVKPAHDGGEAPRNYENYGAACIDV